MNLLSWLESEQDTSVRRALIQIAAQVVGESRKEDRSAASERNRMINRELLQHLLDLSQTDPDPGIHGACEWVLKYSGQEIATPTDAREQDARQLAGDWRWYGNRQGHTMVIIPGPAEFTMGSPKTEPLRGDHETAHTHRIRRSFSIASKEVTGAQFQRFLRDNPQIHHTFDERFSPEGNSPQTSVTWYEAASYCNWLSAQDEIPPDQWCYLPNDDSVLAEGMAIAPDYLTRRGYRLPTEAEWEFACRAGTVTSRYFGDLPELLSHYAAFQENAQDRTLPVGSLRPNEWGLFDMHGNVAEWCQDAFEESAQVATGTDGNAGVVRERDARVLRGGSFQDARAQIRSAARAKSRPGNRHDSGGFRVCRSFP